MGQDQPGMAGQPPQHSGGEGGGHWEVRAEVGVQHQAVATFISQIFSKQLFYVPLKPAGNLFAIKCCGGRRHIYQVSWESCQGCLSVL